jgi:tyrosinase
MDRVSRRHFMVRSGLSIAAIGAAPAILTSASSGQPAPVDGLPGGDTPVRVRRNVMDLDADGPEMNAYRDAVKAMSNLKPTDRRNWLEQADIHRKGCPHGNWWFLPWHRAYLLQFERICRVLIDKPDFALPYWDWTTHPTLPPAFVNPGDVLRHTRDLGDVEAIPEEYVGQKVIDDLWLIGDFSTFASAPTKGNDQKESPGLGQLEGVPHNNVHGAVGGDMGFVPRSARDPLFWLHHANVDRLWTKWLSFTGHANPDATKWLDKVFTDFADEKGNPVDSKVRDLLSTHRLGYRYPEQPKSDQPPLLAALTVESDALAFSVKNNNTAWAETPLTVALKLPAELQSRVAKLLEGPAQTPATLRVTLRGVDLPADPKAKIRVFVNCPYLSAQTPISDKHYVTTLGFFPGHENHDGGEHPATDHASGEHTFLVNVASTVTRLGKAKAYKPGDPLRVQLLATGGDPQKANPAIEIKPSDIGLNFIGKI